MPTQTSFDTMNCSGFKETATRLCLSRLSSKRIKLLFAIFILISAPFIYFEFTAPVRYVFKNFNTSSACVIPQLNPFDTSILRFVFKPEPLVCDSSLSIIFINDAGFVQFNQSALAILKEKESSLSCAYKTVHRNYDDKTVNFSSMTPFQPSPTFYIDSDVFYVECKDTNSDKLMFKELLTAAKKVDGIQLESQDQLSVLMFGLDSVSRSSAVRKLPKTFGYLTEELQSYDFKGYMKVGENSLPNIAPLLTGRKVHPNELPIENYQEDAFDPLPFLWKNFSAKQYATFYAEDKVKFGTFQYLNRGFFNQPTDHYATPYFLAINELVEKGNVNTWSHLCYNNKPNHLILIEYYKQFIKRHAGKRKFGLSFINELSHDYQNFLEYGDEDFMEFFKWLKHGGHLDNTVLILFSDHGLRKDNIRMTFVGRIEDRMPLLQIVLPDHIKNKYPKLHTNLQINTNRLTTAFDLHQTLLDVLLQNFNSPTKGYVDDVLRSISLFQPVPSVRSCRDAAIPEPFCACYISTKVAVTEHISQLLGEKTVEELNHKFKSNLECAQLALNSIMDLRILSNGLKHVKTENVNTFSFLQFFRPEGEKVEHYTISIETVPGNGVFEATVDVTSQSNIQVVDVVRINTYGDQSKCTSIKLLKPFCFCKGMADKVKVYHL